MFLQPVDAAWVLLWKFPVDLNSMAGFEQIQNIPLPVGSYDTRLDRNVQAVGTPAERSLPAGLPQPNNIGTKLRVDLNGNWSNGQAKGISALLFRERENELLAMITSVAITSGGYGGNSSTQNALLQKFVSDLYSMAGIYALPCHQSHHAIVFYKDAR